MAMMGSANIASMRPLALSAFVLVFGIASPVTAQQPTRRELRARCIAQCDRMPDICRNFMHRTQQECSTVDQQCRQNCDTQYPPPPGEAPAAAPPGTTVIRPVVRPRR